MKWECKKPGLWICWETKGKYWGWVEKSKFGGSGWFSRVYDEYNNCWESDYSNFFVVAKNNVIDIINENEHQRSL